MPEKKETKLIEKILIEKILIEKGKKDTQERERGKEEEGKRGRERNGTFLVSRPGALSIQFSSGTERNWTGKDKGPRKGNSNR